MSESKVAALKLERKTLGEINKPHEKNPRRHPSKGSQEWDAMVKSLSNDYFDPIIWNQRNGKLVSGHFRVKVMLSEGYTHADVVVVDYDEQTHVARMIAANNHSGTNDKSLLEELLTGLTETPSALGLTGYTSEDVIEMMRPPPPVEPPSQEVRQTLAEKFGLTPLSVLDARQHYWKKRAEAWEAILGFESPCDPVLTEAIMRWYTTTQPNIIDLSGKDALRGLVAGNLGFGYVGITDEGNAAANNALVSTKSTGWEKVPRYVVEDENIGLYDLAIYEAPAFSSMKEMYDVLERQINKAHALLQDNRFLVVIVGAQKKLQTKSVYDAESVTAFAVEDSAKAFNLYNEVILLRPLGGTPMQCRSFPATRRLARCHSLMLVFYKGKQEEIERQFPFPAMGDLS